MPSSDQHLLASCILANCLKGIMARLLQASTDKKAWFPGFDTISNTSYVVFFPSLCFRGHGRGEKRERKMIGVGSDRCGAEGP